MPAKSPQLLLEYQQLFDTCIIRPEKYNLIDTTVTRISNSRAEYEKVSARTGVPWFIIGIIHTLEGGGNFRTHLHNGDPLTARTVHVPKNRPISGTPPFRWEDSAADALLMRKLDKVQQWDVPEMLYQLEAYNGFGYRVKGIHSPYLWSFSNHYSKGKYTADGLYDPNAVSKQTGAAVILRRMAEKQTAVSGESDRLTLLKTKAGEVKFNPKTYSLTAEELQRMLNLFGQALRVDGFAGRNTSDALYRITGTYLKGDSKRPN